jgi:hypothetical protein
MESRTRKEHRGESTIEGKKTKLSDRLMKGKERCSLV